MIFVDASTDVTRRLSTIGVVTEYGSFCHYLKISSSHLAEFLAIIAAAQINKNQVIYSDCRAIVDAINGGTIPKPIRNSARMFNLFLQVRGTIKIEHVLRTSNKAHQIAYTGLQLLRQKPYLAQNYF